MPSVLFLQHTEKLELGLFIEAIRQSDMTGQQKLKIHEILQALSRPGLPRDVFDGIRTVMLYLGAPAS